MATTNIQPTFNYQKALTEAVLNLNLLRTCPVELNGNYFTSVKPNKKSFNITVNGGDCSNDPVFMENSFILGDDNLLHKFTVESNYYEDDDITVFTVTLIDGTLPMIKNPNAKYADLYDNIVDNLYKSGEVIGHLLTGSSVYDSSIDSNGDGRISMSDSITFINNAKTAEDGTLLPDDYLNDLWLVKFYTPSVTTDDYDSVHKLIEKGWTYEGTVQHVNDVITGKIVDPYALDSSTMSNGSYIFDINKDGFINGYDEIIVENEHYQFVQNNMKFNH